MNKTTDDFRLALAALQRICGDGPAPLWLVYDGPDGLTMMIPCVDIRITDPDPRLTSLAGAMLLYAGPPASHPDAGSTDECTPERLGIGPLLAASAEVHASTARLLRLVCPTCGALRAPPG